MDREKRMRERDERERGRENIGEREGGSESSERETVERGKRGVAAPFSTHAQARPWPGLVCSSLAMSN